MDQREGIVSVAALRRVLRELFAKKNMGVQCPFDPLHMRGLTLLLVGGGGGESGLLSPVVL